ncbi:OLC1v1025173C1, partial [Oldenlandia corymbosa var. corymbosa]
ASTLDGCPATTSSWEKVMVFEGLRCLWSDSPGRRDLDAAFAEEMLWISSGMQKDNVNGMPWMMGFTGVGTSLGGTLLCFLFLCTVISVAFSHSATILSPSPSSTVALRELAWLAFFLLLA